VIFIESRDHGVTRFLGPSHTNRHKMAFRKRLAQVLASECSIESDEALEYGLELYNPQASLALTSAMAVSTSAATSRKNWLRSGEAVMSGTGAAVS